MSARGTIQVGQHRYRIVGTRGDTIGEGEFESDNGLAELLTEALGSHRRVEWALEAGRPWAQVRRISDLPPVKDRHLTGLVRSDGSRYFRLRPGELHVEARRESDDAVLGIAVDAWLPAAVSAAARLGGGGLVSTTVVGAGDARHSVTPPEVRRDRRRLGTRAVLAWTPIAIVPWLVAGAVYAADLHQDLRTLEIGQKDLAAAERELAQIEVELGEASEVVGSVQRTGRSAAWALPLLASLARELPVTASLMALTAERTGACTMELTGDTTGFGSSLGVHAEASSDASAIDASACR